MNLAGRRDRRHSSVSIRQEGPERLPLPTFLLSGAVGGADAFETNLFAGLTYANIHDQTFPGGEIRGQLNAVPEPSTLALIGTGVVGLVQGRRRRKTS